MTQLGSVQGQKSSFLNFIKKVVVLSTDEMAFTKQITTRHKITFKRRENVSIHSHQDNKNILCNRGGLIGSHWKPQLGPCSALRNKELKAVKKPKSTNLLG